MKQKRLSLLFCIVYGVAIFASQFFIAYNVSWPYAFSSEYARNNSEFIDGTLLYLDYQKNSLGYLEVYLTAKEASHMNDVKYLFGLYHIVMIQSLILTGLIACYIAITDASRTVLWNILKRSSYILAGVSAFVGIIFGAFFKPLFIMFHQTLFTNDDWLLPRDAILIKLFPEQTFVIILAITLLSTLLIHLLVGLSMTYADTYTKRKTQ